MTAQPPDLAELREAIVAGDGGRARELARLHLAAEGDPVAAVELGFGAGLRRVGELWESGDYFLPELVQGAEAMKSAMAELLPALAARAGGVTCRGRVVLGTVRGDLHDIGKSLVGVLLAAHGFEIHDLGVDVPAEAFVARAREVGAEIVAASALLTTTMVGQRSLAEALRAAALPSRPRLLVGGAPTTPRWAEEIGAHHAENALRAVDVAARLVS